MPTEEAWGFYSLLPEFVAEEVVFSQFKSRLRDHRKQVKARRYQSERERQALEHDRQLYPRQKHNDRGEPVFDLSEAKKFLREDVRAESTPQ